MTLQTYGLDREAHKLIVNHLDVFDESHKMRVTVAYGLERFWGEHLRLQEKQQPKAAYWEATWDALVKIMSQAGVTIPNDPDVEMMAKKLWGEIGLDGTPQGVKLTLDDQRIALAVLTQLCDCLVWWTQRYK